MGTQQVVSCCVREAIFVYLLLFLSIFKNEGLRVKSSGRNNHLPVLGLIDCCLVFSLPHLLTSPVHVWQPAVHLSQLRLWHGQRLPRRLWWKELQHKIRKSVDVAEEWFCCPIIVQSVGQVCVCVCECACARLRARVKGCLFYRIISLTYIGDAFSLTLRTSVN